MLDFTVDCPMFLRLANISLGEIGLYQVTTGGISATTTEQDIEDSPLGAQQSAILLEHIRDARLLFPTTAQQLLGWMEKNTEMKYLFPTWFETIAASSDASRARAVLDEVATNLDAVIQGMESDIAALPSKPVSDKYLARVKLSEVRAEREAVASIDALLPSAATVRASKAAKARHEKNPSKKDQAIKHYREGSNANKNDISPTIAAQVGAKETSVRKWLQNVKHPSEEGGTE